MAKRCTGDEVALSIDQHCTAFFVGCTTPHLIRIVAMLFERDETEIMKIIISSAVLRIKIKCGNGVAFKPGK